MPSLKFYDVWKPEEQDVAVLIAGDREIYNLFVQHFSEYQCMNTWKPRSPTQKAYDYGFYVKNTSEKDIPKFKKWLRKQVKKLTPIILENDVVDLIYALGYHGEPLLTLINMAKPYGQPPTSQTKEAARKVAQFMVKYIQQKTEYKQTDYFVAVPSQNKQFDLPRFVTNVICEETSISNGSQFVNQTRPKKHQQKNLDAIEEKRANVRGLFGVKANNPFSDKVITIIDDIYRSGITVEELAKTLKKTGARRIQALVITKTFRD